MALKNKPEVMMGEPYVYPCWFELKINGDIIACKGIEDAPEGMSELEARKWLECVCMKDILNCFAWKELGEFDGCMIYTDGCCAILKKKFVCEEAKEMEKA